MVPTSSVIAQAGGQDDIAPQVRAVQDRQCLLWGPTMVYTLYTKLFKYGTHASYS